MNILGISDIELRRIIEEYISDIDEEILNQFDDLRDERMLSGALQSFLANKKFTEKIKNEFRQKNLNLDINLRAITEKSELKTGVDFSIILSIFSENNVIQKSLIIQAKNRETDYGKKIRVDQLEKMLKISEYASILLYFTNEGMEITHAKEILDNSIEKYNDIKSKFKKDFTEFMFEFFKCTKGDHNKKLFDKIKDRNLSNYVEYKVESRNVR